ncbi:MAG: tungstate ABC transporter substrate-binding protein WtpA [Epsilonproteobacteria bacterium]|nr:tungstate ABC transporter substrate-binding protein WtpA [Campylobacterota bacterium]
MKKVLLGIALVASIGLAKQNIVIFHAGSLSVPFAQMAKAFETKYPQYKVLREPAGSRACARKITDVGKPADVMASADYKVISNLLMPKNAKFDAQFATNELAIVYTDKSKYANEINSKNWPKILLRKGVKVGHSNPNIDPAGYRAMLVTKLAEKYYKIPGFFKKLFGYGDSYTSGEENKNKVIIRPKETDLLGLLEVGAFDYLYIYKSVAQQHHLKYITLPPQVSLKSAKYASFYKTVSFKISGKKPGTWVVKRGGPMIYGITVVQNSKSPIDKEGAVKFVNFVLSPEGQAIMKQNGQDPINPPIITGDASILGR